MKYQEGMIVGKNGIILKKRLYPYNNGKSYRCIFECPLCGKEFEADLYNITCKNSKYKSCGCYKKENVQFKVKNLSGLKFGKLTVLRCSDKKVPHPKGGYFYFWDCQCECGNLTTVSTSHLTTGHTISCGKCCISKGEDKIKQILINQKINFIQQQRFNDCRDKNPLPFDFYLPDYNCCIEYDGEQHFHIPKNQKSTFFTKEKINNIQKHDIIKNKYCEDNKINLIRIPYYDYDILDNNYILNKIGGA